MPGLRKKGCIAALLATEILAHEKEKREIFGKLQRPLEANVGVEAVEV